MIADRFVATPNFGERKNGKRPEYVILHFTAVEGTDEVCQLLCDLEREVSAHYVLGEDGEIVQMVEEEKRAWHAGASYWAGETDLNSCSIGIEIVNNGARPFKDIQYQRLIPLIQEICERWNIPPQNVLGHSDIAIGRKFDPGPWFDWTRLDRSGVSMPPRVPDGCATVRKDQNGFRTLADIVGYNTDVAFEELLLAIRIRHGATPYYDGLREEDFSLLISN